MRIQRTFRSGLVAGLLSILVSIAVAADALVARVVDVGAGECVIVKIPGDHYIIYDAGNWEDGGKSAMKAIREMIPQGQEVDLLVLSHSDGDHLGAVEEIMDEYKVKRVLHSGYRRTTKIWKAADDAIKEEALQDGAIDMDLSKVNVSAGSTFRLGSAFATVVAGYHKPPTSWGKLDQSEERNAGSIVIRVLYAGKSILLCGDAVGRHIGDPIDAIIAIEKVMVENAPAVRIDSDVIVAPHHGADNGSSMPFIRAVNPEFVIFSAGHKHEHPRKTTADRYLAAGVNPIKIFRTDRGDDENGTKEWKEGSVAGNEDPIGDDDVEIRITIGGGVSVKYVKP